MCIYNATANYAISLQGNIEELWKNNIINFYQVFTLKKILESWNHRIIEWFGLEGTFEAHLVQPPCNNQGYLQLDQVGCSEPHPTRP